MEFVLVVEAGILERQAVLLCESVRRFCGDGIALTVISPRAERRPGEETLQALAALGAEYLALELASPTPEYGPSYRIAAAAWAERRPGPETLVQLDSDTLFLGRPDFAFEGAGFLARPVDLAGLSTTGSDCIFDPFWRELCRLGDAEYEDLPFVTTTICGAKVRANYNAGLVVARRSLGLFQRTEATFARLADAGLKPFEGLDAEVKSGAGMVSREGSAFWGTSQAAFAIAAAAAGATGRVLPPGYNVPLHLLDIPQRPSNPWVHVHYHWLANEDDASDVRLTDPGLGLPPEAIDWLRPRLPLTPP